MPINSIRNAYNTVKERYFTPPDNPKKIQDFENYMTKGPKYEISDTEFQDCLNFYGRENQGGNHKEKMECLIGVFKQQVVNNNPLNIDTSKVSIENQNKMRHDNLLKRFKNSVLSKMTGVGYNFIELKDIIIKMNPNTITPTMSLKKETTEKVEEAQKVA